MFEMFVLLINEINPHSFCFVSYLFSFYLHAWSSPTQRIAPHDFLYCIFENLPWEFAVVICRRNLQWLFAVRICRAYLPWVFCIYKRILFIWRQTFFICVQKFLIWEIFFINSASSCYCRGSYGPPYCTALIVGIFERIC